MIFNIDDLKKKIIYRATYRGTKELDKLLSSFTRSIINELNDAELIDLSSLLELDDENLYKFNHGLRTTVTIKDNKVSKLFRDFKHE